MQLPRHIVALAACLAVGCGLARAQEGMFRKDAFTQSYADASDTAARDTSDTMFSFREFFGGVAHKRNVRIGSLFAGSTVFIGAEQIHNRDYWKLPIVYGGIGGGIGGAFYFRGRYHETGDAQYRTYGILCLAGAGLTWWGSLMDGTANYKRGDPAQHPGRATIYSILLPGLGQAYNGEYWKIPIYWGGLALAGHFLWTNNVNYLRFKDLHNLITSDDPPSDLPAITADNAVYYRNLYRRYRDYSILALAAVYLIQVIDANVFAYLQDFELNDSITMGLSPTVITPDTRYALNPAQSPAVGLRLGLTF